MKVFRIIAASFFIATFIAGAILGYSTSSTHGMAVRILEAVFMGIVVTIVVLYAILSIIAIIEGIFTNRK